MADSTSVRAEDQLPVRSRVSWGAVFAGATIALGLYFLLTLIGRALGLSVGDRSLASGWVAVWAILTVMMALFVGGWVTSQLTEGENTLEAAMHGVILWSVLFTVLLWLMASGVKGGFNAMLGLANTGETVSQDTNRQDWEAAALRAGVSQETIDVGRRQAAAAPENTRRSVEDAQNQQEAASRVAWWAVLGTTLSLVAALAGALVGARPPFTLRAFEEPYRRLTQRFHQPANRS